ncbi:methionine synthase [uncultured Jatrophihabitans sp.]|uniref:methionine synthase n=1 Tax=uncultured Jatrophihabitans sp. TaxID=1610747 RepID=UPI0035CA409D
MTSSTRPWPPGAVTGIGSLPGDDPADTAALVVGELPDLPHLAELPARGAGADMIGRTAALLVDLPVEIVPSGWRLAAHAGRDLRRARDFLAYDLDALEAAAAGAGALKTQAAGPWTLAAHLELPNGHKVVSDPGATRDLAESLAEGLAVHLADLSARVSGVQPVLQLDEPSVPAVLGGRVSTPSGYGTIRSVEESVVEQTLAGVLAVAAAGARVVHSCGADVPIELLRRAGADAISLDASLLTQADFDALGEAVDAGVSLWLGLLPSTDAAITLDTARGPLDRLWSQLGFPPALLARTVVPTPACGLAGASPAYVRRALALLRDLGKDMIDRQ